MTKICSEQPTSTQFMYQKKTKAIGKFKTFRKMEIWF